MKQQGVLSQLTTLLNIFIAIVLQKQYCFLSWFYKTTFFYCAGFIETMLSFALVVQKRCCLLRCCYRNILFILLVSQKLCCLLRWFYKNNIHSLRNVLFHYSFILIAKQVTCWWSCQSDMCCAFQLRSYNQFCTAQKVVLPQRLCPSW